MLDGRASEFEADLPIALFTEALDRYLAALGERAVGRLGLADPAALASALPALGAGRRRRTATACTARCATCSSASRPPGRSCSASTTSTGPTRPRSTRSPRSRTGRQPRPSCSPSRRAGRLPPPLAAALAAALRDGRVTALSLPADRGRGRRARRRAARAIYAAAGGNPFYLEQLARARQRGGRTAGDRATGLAAAERRSSTTAGARAVAAALAAELAR